MDDTLTLYLATTEIDLAKAATDVARALEQLEDANVRVVSGRPGEPVDVTLARVQRVDAVVVLTAHLFGWVPAEEDGGDGRRSMTWLECQAALDAKVPVLAYVLDPLSDWSHRTTPSRRARTTATVRVGRQLEQFKRWLGHEAAQVEYFERPAQLPDLVGFSVLSHLRRRQAPTQSGLTTLEDLAALDAALGPVDDEPMVRTAPQAHQEAQRLPDLQPRSVRIETVRGSATTDRPTDEDALGMAPYVDAVARFLASDDTDGPLTLSIEGPWGSGKSSFLLQLERRLGEVAPGLHPVRFDAWRLQRAEQPWAAYALAIYESLAERAGPRARLASAWQVRSVREGFWNARIRLALTAVAAVLGVGAAWLAPLVLGLATEGLTAALGVLGGLGLACVVTGFALSRVLRLRQSPLEADLRAALAGEARVPSAELQRDLGVALRALAQGSTVVCYVDDLDRCEVPDAMDLLVAHERLGEELPLVGVLAMDRDKLAARVAGRDGVPITALLGIDRADQGLRALELGYETLERFVQLPVSLPRPDSGRLAVFVDEALTALANDGARGHWLPGGPVQRGARAALAQWEPEATPRREAIEVQLGQDSANVRELVLRLAPGLDHNPRRLKRFVNGFRLAAYIASSTGLFSAPVTRDHSPLTLQQLGKVVALGLRWPLALADLVRHHGLAAQLERVAVTGALSASEGERVRRWAERPALLALFRAGVEEGSDEEERERWSLARLDWRQLSPLAPALQNAARVGDADLFPLEATEDLPLRESQVG